jgi:hypothetical protein
VDPDEIKEVLTLKQEFGQSNLAASEDFKNKIQEHDPRVAEVLARYEEAFGPLPPPGSSKKLVRMDLELKPEYQDQRITSRGYPCSKEDQDEIMRQVLELVEAGMCEAYKDTEIPEHCSPCFLVAKPGSTAKRLVVDYRKLNKMIKLHAGSLPVMENTIENAASCKFKSKMDKRSGFWQVDLTERAKELMAFRTPNGRVFRWLVMPFGIANAPALFQELMNQVLTILKQRPAVQALLERGAVAEAHIDDVLLGTNSIEDHLLLLSEFFDVCVEQNLRIKLEKCEFLKTELEYLGFRVGDGHWGPCEDKLKPLMDFTIDGVKGKAEGVKKIRQFIGGCNFYRRHARNFTESSAILTDLIKDNTPWKWTDEEKNKLEELKEKICKAIPLGVPRPKGEIVFVSDGSNVGGGGTLFQWQALRPEQCQEINERLGTQGVNRDGGLKHSYKEEVWRLVPLRHWNWKWNAARSKYHTYEHELLGGVLVLASQQRIIRNNPITWLCYQDSVK